MGILDFVKDIGMSLFSAEEQAAEKITAHLTKNNPGLQDVEVTVKDGVANIKCSANDKQAAEKAILMIGNVRGVSQVNYNIKDLATANSIDIKPNLATETPDLKLVPPTTEDIPKVETTYYDIKSGDNLSSIAKKFYGNPNAYKLIFEANKEVIVDPDKIFPGQRIRIPHAA
jgi:nucleoid-associated protein YgaU